MTAKTETREGVTLPHLHPGMDVQVPEGQRRWYRILSIQPGDHIRRLADVEVLGGKHVGTRTQITLFDREAGYKVRVPIAAPVVAPSPEPAASAASAVRDHSKCGPHAHTREAPGNTRQVGDDDSDGQLVDQHGEILCNDCTAPLAWCDTFDDYFHLDPSTPPCFLVREALNTMECDGCGGVLNVTRWWDGEQVRYADPECAATLYLTELAVVKLGDTVSENYSASGEDLSTTHAEITAAGDTLASFGGPVSEEFDVAEWDRLLAEAGFRRVGFWNFVEYTAPVARVTEESPA